MARESSITQEQVNAAADAIRASGAKPTARAIRDQLGTGSMATVLKFLQSWQSTQAPPLRPHVVVPDELSKSLTEYIDKQIAAGCADLMADLGASRDDAERVRSESEQRQMTIDGLTNELEQERAEKAELQGKLGQMESDLATARDEAARERQAAEVARTELAKAQLRLEALPRIEAEADRLRQELDTERKARAEAEQKAAVLASKVEYETDLRQKADTDLVEHVRMAEDAAKRALASAEALGNERVAVQAAQARLEAAARELSDAKKEVEAARAAAKKAGEEAAELRGKLLAAASDKGAPASPSRPSRPKK